MQHFQLDEGVVYVWRIDLRVSTDLIRSCRILLCENEIQRADRFHFETDRQRYIAAHGQIRSILSAYLNVAPQQVSYSYGSHGKPELAEKWQSTGIQFNLSHCRDLALLAVAKGDRVGVDVEFINGEFAGDEVAKRFFSASEIRTLCALPQSESVQAFFDCWTRKEAFIKALGQGMSCPLDSFAVAFGPGVRPALLRAEPDAEVSSRWSIYELIVPKGYAGALVVEGKHHRVIQVHWEGKP